VVPFQLTHTDCYEMLFQRTMPRDRLVKHRMLSKQSRWVVPVCSSMKIRPQPTLWPRDGRMRRLIQDERITPSIYRVNGLFASPSSLQVSFVVVGGGVGDSG
jgi:hypothetical protein